MPRLFVTGFGSFLDVDDNPSAHLARATGLPHSIFEVAYDGVDEQLASLDPSSFDQLLMIGIARGAEKMRIELVARNQICDLPDARGSVQGPAPIAVGGPENLTGSLWRHPALLEERDVWQPSVDAGSYLCNYAYYQALRLFPNKEVGFLHVPAFDAIPQERQVAILAEIINLTRLSANVP
jgi:pyrrolidone-carboxylate peptidase